MIDEDGDDSLESNTILEERDKVMKLNCIRFWGRKVQRASHNIIIGQFHRN